MYYLSPWVMRCFLRDEESWKILPQPRTWQVYIFVPVSSVFSDPIMGGFFGRPIMVPLGPIVRVAPRGWCPPSLAIRLLNLFLILLSSLCFSLFCFMIELLTLSKPTPTSISIQRFLLPIFCLCSELRLRLFMILPEWGWPLLWMESVFPMKWDFPPSCCCYCCCGLNLFIIIPPRDDLCIPGPWIPNFDCTLLGWFATLWEMSFFITKSMSPPSSSESKPPKPDIHLLSIS